MRCSDVTEVATTVTKVTTVKVTKKKQEKDEEQEQEEEEKPEWDGPTTNFHVKQLGLDDKVDIYAPVAQQQQDVQRVRERAKYMPSGEGIQSLKTSSDSEADSDFAPKLSQESQEAESAAVPEVDPSEVRELAEEAQEFEQQTVEAHRSWAKSLFVVTPLFLVALAVLLFALLFALDWSQETFQFCEVDVESADGTFTGSGGKWLAMLRLPLLLVVDVAGLNSAIAVLCGRWRRLGGLFVRVVRGNPVAGQIHPAGDCGEGAGGSGVVFRVSWERGFPSARPAVRGCWRTGWQGGLHRPRRTCGRIY
jgi:hypothetical protein